MSEQEKQEGQKTVVAFIAGLLIGGLLVWIFTSPSNGSEVTVDEETSTTTEQQTEGEDTDDTDDQTTSDDQQNETEEPTPEMVTGDGEVTMGGQQAGTLVTFESITFPLDEGWIAVRSYNNDQLGNVLGASRFSKSQGLIPEAVQLLAPTVEGREYAVVFFTEDGDRAFNLAQDSQIDGIYATFTAQ